MSYLLPGMGFFSLVSYTWARDDAFGVNVEEAVDTKPEQIFTILGSQTDQNKQLHCRIN